MSDNVIFPGFFIGDKRDPEPPEVQLKDAIIKAGMVPPDQVYIDGQLHRFSADGKRDKSAWYVAYGDGIPAGRFGDWRHGTDHTWRADIGRELSAVEMMSQARRHAEAKAARDAARAQQYQCAAESVAAIWRDLGAASPEHPYLIKKGVQPHGARVTGDGRLVVPVYDAFKNLISLQYIDHHGGKLYHPGASTKGGSWWIGSIDSASDVYLCEGYATAASIHEATRAAVAIAYTAGNLTAVAQQLKGKGKNIVIVADNDESGTGQREAERAARETGARVVMPPIQGDANDYAQSGADLAALLKPPAVQPDQALVWAADFCKQQAPIAWGIKGWIQDEALIMIHGPSGGGKTFVVLDMMLHIASAGITPDGNKLAEGETPAKTEWLGRKIKKGGGDVIYLAGEGHHGLRGRVAAWCQHHQVKAPRMLLSKQGYDLNTPEGYQKVRMSIRDSGCDLDNIKCITIDTLHRFLDGDENSAQDTKSMLDACSALINEFKCTVILVHHTGNSAEAQHRARGSSAWRGALDIEISVVPGEDGRPIEIIQRKSKDAELAAPIYVRLRPVDIEGWKDEDGEQVTSVVIEQAEAPPPRESGKKTDRDYVAWFKAAWVESPWQVRRYDGMTGPYDAPFVSRGVMEAYLKSAHSDIIKCETTLKNHLKPSRKGGVIHELLENGAIAIVDATEDGWRVKDELLARKWIQEATEKQGGKMAYEAT